MISSVRLPALVNPVTQRPYLAPAVHLASARTHDYQDAYLPAGPAQGYRPNRIIRTAAQLLDAPCEPATLHTELVALTMCPITSEPMVDPVIAEDGYTYSATAIRAWFATSGSNARSPMTNLPMRDVSLISNAAMRSLMEDLGMDVDHNAVTDLVVPSDVPDTFEASSVLRRENSPDYNVAEYNFGCEQLERLLRQLSQGVSVEDTLWQRVKNSYKAKKAMPGARKLLNRAPSNMRAIRNYIDLQLVHGNLRDGLAWIQGALEQHPNHKDLLARRAFVYMAQGQIERGTADLGTLLDTVPSYANRSANALVTRGMLPWAATAAFGYAAYELGEQEQSIRFMHEAQSQFYTRTVKKWLAGEGA